MEPGDVLVIQAYAEHQLQAIEDVYMVEALNPGSGVRGSAFGLAE